MSPCSHRRGRGIELFQLHRLAARSRSSEGTALPTNADYCFTVFCFIVFHCVSLFYCCCEGAALPTNADHTEGEQPHGRPRAQPDSRVAAERVSPDASHLRARLAFWQGVEPHQLRRYTQRSIAGRLPAGHDKLSQSARRAKLYLKLRQSARRAKLCLRSLVGGWALRLRPQK
eukprot:SAG31_NODE_7906_length_1568_cov_1.875425_1_plen_173_part_00